MKAKFLVLFVLLVGMNYIFSQKNLSLYNLRGTPQALAVNPSFMPKSKIYLSMPLGMMNFGVSNSGFSFNDLFTKRADDSLVINTESVINGLSANNILSAESNIEIFGIGIKISDTYFNFTLNSKIQTNFIYPKDVFKLAFEGNGKSFIGERASFDGLGVNFNAFTEYAFGVTKEINDKLTIGGKFKMISGIANFNTRQTNLGLYTDPTTFALTIDGSAEINSSNIFQFVNDSTSSSDQLRKEMTASVFNFSNKGLGIDFGATYKINEKFSVNASVIDLGSIRWNSNVTSYKTDNFNYTFEGIDLNKLISDSTEAFTTIQDSLGKAFNYEENNDAYSTSLYTKIYLGGNYYFNKSFNAGAVLLSQFVKGKYSPSLSLSMNVTLKSWLSATLNYSIMNKTYNNVGAGISLRGGPMQFFVMSDNILAFTNPLGARTFHICGGISIFIKEKAEKKKDKNEKAN
ncbi:MAG: DUF5723 family protein [Flavobacteriia bacterium]|jgi:hypothetical protein